MILFDKITIPSEREYTANGFLRVPARISRTGIQAYTALEMGLSDRDPSDIIQVYRPESEVFSDVSINSFSSTPVTNNHPPESLNPKNTKDFTVGFSGDVVVRDGDYLKTTLNIINEQAIKNIEDGKCELSNGYSSDIEWIDGTTPSGETYNAIQRNIIGNHIAIVDRGRAGHACRVADSLQKPKEESTMKIIIDGVDFEVTDQVGQAVNKIQAQLHDAEKELEEKDEEQEKKDMEAEKEKDELKAKADEAESKVPSADQLDSLVAERTVVIDAALKIDSSYEWVGKDELTIRKEIVASNCKSVQIDSVSNDYIKARFDMLVESSDAPKSTLDGAIVKQLDDTGKPKDTRSPSVIARDKMMNDSRNAWKRG